jgi:predicted glycoside hydrolase/deacetylase ChbG (UPF0249 family)
MKLPSRRSALAALAGGLVAAQTRPAPARPGVRLIVQGDDMGAAHAINTATIRAYNEGILRSTNVIVPGPWFLEAAQLLSENPGLDAGVHLCLTSEWERVKWRPLTVAPSLVDADGYFFPMVWPRRDFPPNTSLKEASPKDEEVERELRRQIEVARKYIPRISYLSEHMGFPALKPEWQALLRRISADTGIPLMEERRGVNYLNGVWRNGAGADFDKGSVRAAKLAARLEKLRPGVYVMVDHCGTNDPEMQALGHKGYEYVAADRAAVVEAWTSPLVLDAVKRLGIQLIGHADLPKLASQ